MSTVVQTDVEVVEAFLQALEDLDVDAAADLLAEDVTYRNVPLPRPAARPPP